MYIVLEYYLMENFIINLFILYLTKVVTKTSITWKRFILGTILSTLYSLVFFIPGLLFMSNFFMKIIISIIVVKITFASKNKKVFFQQILGFYTISFIFAGVITSISWGSMDSLNLIFDKLESFYIFKTGHVILGINLGIIVAFKIFNYNFKANLKGKYIVKVSVFSKYGSSNFKALIDTGNNLTTPFGNKAVFIVELKEICNLLPEAIEKIYIENSIINYEVLEENWTRINKDMKFKIIPFKSLGKEEGIILGFEPDYILVYLEDKSILIEDIIIGIYPATLSGNREYTGLLNYEGITGGDYYEKSNI